MQHSRREEKDRETLERKRGGGQTGRKRKAEVKEAGGTNAVWMACEIRILIMQRPARQRKEESQGENAQSQIKQQQHQQKDTAAARGGVGVGMKPPSAPLTSDPQPAVEVVLISF